MRKAVVAVLALMVWLGISVEANGAGDQETRRGVAGARVSGKGGEHLAGGVRTEEGLRLRVFHQVWAAVRDHYYDEQMKGLDWGKMRVMYRPLAAAARDETAFYRVINRMLSELEDAHTVADAPSEVREEDREQRLGLGLSSEIVDNRVVLTGVAAGSAAADAGVRPGWIMTHFDGVAVDPGQKRTPVVPSGRAVRFKFLDEQNREHEVDMIARPYRFPRDRRVRNMEDGILYVRLDSFDEGRGSWFRRVLEKNADARACIIDLRGNPGGLITELRACLNVLFTEKTVFGESIERSGRRIELKAGGTGSLVFTGDVIVLIDRRSYSAAELFAAAVRDSGRGTVVGRTSGGIALLALHRPLADGGEVSVSFRDYVTTRGERIEGRGVRPDVLVPKRLEDLRQNVDRDLETSLGLARRSAGEQVRR